MIDSAQVPPAIAFMVVALAAWTYGHRVGAPRGIVQACRRRMRTVFPPGRWALRFSSLPIGLYLVGLMARGLRLSSGRFAYLQDPTVALSSPSSQNQALGIVEDLCTYGLVLAALDAFVLSRSLRSRLILALLTIAEIATGLLAGSKETVILTVASVGLVYVFGRGSIPTSAKVGAIFIVLVVFPLNQEYRSRVRDGTDSVSAGAALGQLQSVLSESATSVTPKDLLIDAPARLARRLRQVDNVALIRQKTPEQISYAPWEELIYGPATGWVPRIFWPSKPILSTGLQFSQVYYDLPDTLYSASAVTIPGDLLRHGGIVPLVLGMALLGVLMRLVDAIFDPSPDLRLLVVFIPVFVLMLKSESDVTVLLVGLLQTLVVACIVGRLSFVTRRS